MSLVDYATAARRRAPGRRPLRFQPGLWLARSIMIIALLMALAPQLFSGYNPLEGTAGAQRRRRRPATGWEPTSWDATCGRGSSMARSTLPPRWRPSLSDCWSAPRSARWPAPLPDASSRW